MPDAELQEAAFNAYNEWLVEMCSAAPDRLVGLALISVYNVDHAVKELRALDEARVARRDDRLRSAGRHRIQRAALRSVLGRGGGHRRADQHSYADQQPQRALPLHARETRRGALSGKSRWK